jgi:glutamine cyclotransferase
MLSASTASYFVYGLYVGETGQIFNAGLFYGESNIYIYELTEGNVLTQSRTIPKEDAEKELQLFSPTGVCAVSDSLFVAQAGKNCISEFRIADDKLLRQHGFSF